MNTEKVLMAKTRKFYEETPYDTVELNDQTYQFLNQNYSYFKTDSSPNGETTVVDMGCGSGWISNYFKNIKMKRVLSLDLSSTTLKLAKERYRLNAAQATNLQIPVKSAVADWVISSGVIHHTPNARKSFFELVRIVKPRGVIYLSTYGQETWYYPFFKYVGGPLRFLYFNVPGMEWVYKALFLPPFYVAGLIRTAMYGRKWAGNRSMKQIWNHFRDFILTPQASFHKYGELEGWFKEGNLEILKYEFGGFGSHNFFLQKKN